MARIGADHVQPALAAHHLAVLANTLHASTHFHGPLHLAKRRSSAETTIVVMAASFTRGKLFYVPLPIRQAKKIKVSAQGYLGPAFLQCHTTTAGSGWGRSAGADEVHQAYGGWSCLDCLIFGSGRPTSTGRQYVTLNLRHQLFPNRRRLAAVARRSSFWFYRSSACVSRSETTCERER
jgi:hypothetical protein